MVVNGVLDGVRSLRAMLSSVLPTDWPRLATDKQFSTTLSLPPFTDCSFKLVAAPAGWADVLIVNLSVLWGTDGDQRGVSTYSLALPVGEYVMKKEESESRDSQLWPQLKNVPLLAESVKCVLSRPAICAARTAHDVVNPSLLGLPDRAAKRILAYLPTLDILRVSACCRALRSLANDSALWRYILRRDFGLVQPKPRRLSEQAAPGAGPGAEQDPHGGDRTPTRTPTDQDDGLVDWRSEYRRLYRARSILQVRRPSSDLSSRLYLAARPLHDSLHSFYRLQLQQLQSNSSLGLIREDTVTATAYTTTATTTTTTAPTTTTTPTTSAATTTTTISNDNLVTKQVVEEITGPPSEKPSAQPPRLQAGVFSLQRFYSGSVVAAMPRRTLSSKSTSSSVRTVPGAQSPARRTKPPSPEEHVVKVGSKVYKALVMTRPVPGTCSGTTPSATPPRSSTSRVKTAQDTRSIARTQIQACRGGRTLLDRRYRRPPLTLADEDAMNTVDLDSHPSTVSSRASSSTYSSRSRSFCRVSSGFCRSLIPNEAVSRRAKKSPDSDNTATARQTTHAPAATAAPPTAGAARTFTTTTQKRIARREDHTVLTAPARSRKREQLHLWSRGNHRPYAPDEDPKYERLSAAPSPAPTTAPTTATTTPTTTATHHGTIRNTPHMKKAPRSSHNVKK